MGEQTRQISRLPLAKRTRADQFDCNVTDWYETSESTICRLISKWIHVENVLIEST